jgi:hypothetical protein
MGVIGPARDPAMAPIGVVPVVSTIKHLLLHISLLVGCAGPEIGTVPSPLPPTSGCAVVQGTAKFVHAQ